MKWGRKKSSPSSPSSNTSVISRVFSVSWFSKPKQKGAGSETTNSAKKERRSELDLSSLPADWRQGRFYSLDEDDPYWRLSFGEERLIQGRRSTGGINPLWYDFDHALGAPSFRSYNIREMDVAEREENWNFSEMVSDIRRMKERKKALAEKNGAIRSRKANVEAEFTREDMKSRLRHRIVKEKQVESGRGPNDGIENKVSNSGERDIFPIEVENMVRIEGGFRKLSVCNSKKEQQIPKSGVKSGNVFEGLNGGERIGSSEIVSVSEWQDLEDRKFKEMKVKTECRKRSANIKTRHINRARAYSPRTECKIRALEDMKRAKMKMKKKEIEGQLVEGKTKFDSFAVVKSSFNPQQDFRDSMVEMIKEKQISQAEDLEELLACYLALNCDEYHDLIIKVFRKVWLDLNGVDMDYRMQNGRYFDN